MFAAQYFVSDVPEEVATQFKRQEFLTSKVIEQNPDEDEDLVGVVADDDLGRITLTEGGAKEEGEEGEKSSSGGCCKFAAKKQNLWKCNTDAKLPEVPIKMYDHGYHAVDTEDRV